MNMSPITTVKKVVMSAVVLKMLLLSFSGKNLIIATSRPNLERRMMRLIEDISAVAIPTSSFGYSLAARTQKKKPNAADEREVSIMKNEFLYRGSLNCLIILDTIGV
jgi:hypothetical protein